MADVLIPRLLDDSMIDRAYALVRNLAPKVTAARWQQFAGPQLRPLPISGPQGFMSIQNGAGCIFGLYRFEVRDTLGENRVLCADNFILANLPGRDRIWAVMAETMDDLARMNGCHSIRAEIFGDLDQSDGERAWITSACADSGYAFDGSRAFKLLPVAPALGSAPES